MDLGVDLQGTVRCFPAQFLRVPLLGRLPPTGRVGAHAKCKVIGRKSDEHHHHGVGIL